MPTRKTVIEWLRKHPEFLNQYADAATIDAEVQFDALNEIADEATPRNVQVAKLRVDTRKWTLVKRMPKKYGDRQEIEHSGEVAFRGSLEIVESTESSEGGDA